MKPNLELQEEIWCFILKWYEDYGFSPLRREIAKGISSKEFVVSSQLVQYHLWNLRKRGRIHFDPLKKRNILIGKKPELSTK